MNYSDTVAHEPVHSSEGSASLVAAIADRSELQDELYLKFRRPLLQVFLQRRIDPDAAQDLLQRTFLQAIKKIRSDGLNDPSNLGGYLYRTATKLAAAYWRGELAHQHDNDCELMTNLRDETLSLEERIDHDILARSVRELIEELPAHRDREVLERFYLREEPRGSICESLNLTSLQLNQVLWRARQRFGEVLRKHGMSRAPSIAAQATDG
jgi:RNA polymerase sigma-70 factor, ECF subfamily